MVPSRFVRSLWLILLFALALTVALPARAQETVDPGVIDELLDTLESGDFLAQEEAGQRLAEIGTAEAVTRLRTIFLSSDNPRPVAVALAGIGTPRAMTILVGALADEELTPRRNAAQVALLNAGEDSVPSLLAGIHALDAVVRRNSATMLGFIGSRRAINPLLQTARDDEDPLVRGEAIWALGEIGDPRVRGALKAISRTDPDLEVRARAQRAVLRLGEDF